MQTVNPELIIKQTSFVVGGGVSSGNGGLEDKIV